MFISESPFFQQDITRFTQNISTSQIEKWRFILKLVCKYVYELKVTQESQIREDQTLNVLINVETIALLKSS
jgi:hypothetical protein